MSARSPLPVSKDQDNGSRDIFGSLHDRIDRVFEDFTRGFSLPSTLSHSGSRAFGMAPRVDVSEDENKLTVSLELPGVEEKDVNITLADNVLTIKGEKKSEIEEKKKDYHLVEREYGRFQRSIRLPYEVETDQVSAHYDKGVLEISLPKSEDIKKKAKTIKIQT